MPLWTRGALLSVLVGTYPEVRSEDAQSCATLLSHGLVAHQAPPSVEFSRQQYWSGLPFPSLGDLPHPGIEPRSPALQARCFTLWVTREAHIPRRGVAKSSYWASLVAQGLKRLHGMWETQVWSLGWEDPVEKEMATHSSILAWRIPWMEEPGWLQSTG